MRRLLAVALLSLVVAPSAPASEDSFPRAVVVGIGNRVSGRIAVGIVGEEGCPWHVAFREAGKQIEARSDLRVAVTAGKRPPARPIFCFRAKRPPENGRSVEQAVEAIREFILHHGDVAYYRTAFAPLVHRLANRLAPGMTGWLLALLPASLFARLLYYSPIAGRSWQSAQPPGVEIDSWGSSPAQTAVAVKASAAISINWKCFINRP